MPIPALTDEGYLPEGIHDCTLAEIEERFGQFQRTDARCRLMERLKVFLRLARSTGFVAAVIVDGSFVTNKDSPNDIDIIIVLHADHDYSAELRPFEYNTVVRSAVRRMFRLDALVGRIGREDLAEHIELFSQVRDRDDIRKGILRVAL